VYLSDGYPQATATCGRHRERHECT